MTTALQIAATALACYGLWRLYLVAARIDPFSRLIVSVGFFGRLVLGQILFWISYLNLPVGRSMQLGGGIWFFGIDGRGFIHFAVDALRSGPEAVLFIDKTTPAFFYVQVVALMIVLFGAVASIGLLLNAAAYLGTAALITRWGSVDGETTPGGKIALLAISITPSWVVWSLQPLKETLFVFCVVAFLFALSRLHEFPGGATGRTAVMRGIGALFVLLASSYAVASMRWYFGFMLWSASALALLIVLAARRPFRSKAAFTLSAAVILSSQTLVAGSGPYMPEVLQRMFQPGTALAALRTAPAAMSREMENARATQEKVVGRTTYVAADDTNDVVQAQTREPVPPPTATETPRVPPQQQSASKPAPAKQLPVPAPSGQAATRSTSRSELPVTAPAKADDAARAAVPADEVVSQPVLVRPAKVKNEPSSPGAVPEAVSGHSEMVRADQSRIQKLLTGVVALALPITVSERLGLLEVSGGRGLWVFAEADTLLFDLMIIVAAVFVVRTIRSRALNRPLFWALLGLAVVATAAIAYVSTNYGTIFRHRSMIYLCLALIPLVVSVAEQRHVRSNVVAE